MNPLVTLLLNSALSLVESALQAEGPAVITYLEDELAKLKEKYATADPLKA
jgi:hypothetical protein